MIVEWLCDIFYWIAGFFVGLLPTFPSFSNMQISITPILKTVGAINSFVDLRMVGTCLLIVLVVYNIKFVWSIIMWIVRKIPGVS